MENFTAPADGWLISKAGRIRVKKGQTIPVPEWFLFDCEYLTEYEKARRDFTLAVDQFVAEVKAELAIVERFVRWLAKKLER